MKKLALLRSLILFVVTSTFASATMIDSFNTPAGGQSICAGVCGLVPSNSFANLPPLEVIGGQRDMSVVRNSGGGRVDGNGNAFDTGDMVFGAISAAGALSLQYDGADDDPLTLSFLLNGGAGINLLGSNGVQFVFTSDLPGGTVLFRFYTDATNFISLTRPVPVAVVPTLTSDLFSSFTETGTFDITQVRAIEIIVTGVSNQDMTFDFFETTTVPEPSSLSFSLIGFGLAGLGLLSRRRK